MNQHVRDNLNDLKAVNDAQATLIASMDGAHWVFMGAETETPVFDGATYYFESAGEIRAAGAVSWDDLTPFGTVQIRVKTWIRFTALNGATTVVVAAMHNDRDADVWGTSYQSGNFTPQVGVQHVHDSGWFNFGPPSGAQLRGYAAGYALNSGGGIPTTAHFGAVWLMRVV